MNAIIRNLPNAITCSNLFCGCISCYMGFQGYYKLALLFIVMGAVFDFFDGMTARLLKVSSAIGKELDSLADDITFGLAPSVIAFYLFKEMTYPEFLQPIAEYIPFTAFLISVFSALRLAKFNIDARQTSSFIGMPTPANALFWGSLAITIKDYNLIDTVWVNPITIFILVVVMSLLLVCELPMFSLKFKNLSWKSNQISYIFIIVTIPLILFLRISGLAATIAWYILLSVITCRKK